MDQEKTEEEGTCCPFMGGEPCLKDGCKLWMAGDFLDDAVGVLRDPGEGCAFELLARNVGRLATYLYGCMADSDTAFRVQAVD